jgi:hypothetical protein
MYLVNSNIFPLHTLAESFLAAYMKSGRLNIYELMALMRGMLY